jgi:C-22 sterol desaturase
MGTNAASFTSPLASARDGYMPTPPQMDYVVDAIGNASLLTIVLTILAVLVAYDQSMSMVLKKDDN